MSIVISMQQTMTSREIATLVESRHDDVKRSIERLAKSGAIQLPPMADVKNDNNQSVSQYHIGKRDSYVIVAQLSPKFTARLVDRWQELEAALPKAFDISDAVALRSALLEYSERVITLENKVATDAPKVAFAEVIRSVDGVCHIGNIGKMFGIGRTKFFKRLREDGILMNNNLPYQKYLDRKYFTVIEQEPYTDSKGTVNPTFTAMVTGAGQVFLAKRYASIESAKA